MGIRSCPTGLPVTDSNSWHAMLPRRPSCSTSSNPTTTNCPSPSPANPSDLTPPHTYLFGEQPSPVGGPVRTGQIWLQHRQLGGKRAQTSPSAAWHGATVLPQITPAGTARPAAPQIQPAQPCLNPLAGHRRLPHRSGWSCPYLRLRGGGMSSFLPRGR